MQLLPLWMLHLGRRYQGAQLASKTARGSSNSSQAARGQQTVEGVLRYGHVGQRELVRNFVLKLLGGDWEGGGRALGFGSVSRPIH